MRESIEKKYQFLPNINKFLVFDIIRKNGPIPISEVIRFTRLSVPTVLKIVKDLTANNYIITKGKGESSGGRKPIIYEFNGNARFFIGIDFEIPKVRMISINLADHIIAQNSYTFNVKEDVTKIIDSLLSALHEIIRASKHKLNKRLAGIGIAISGFINSKEGVSISTPRMPHWKNVPIAKIIGDEFGVPVRLINDADASMMAEIKFGLEDMNDNLIYIAFNEGLGAGLLVNGKIISGKFGNAGLIGHTTVNAKGLQCICGNKGCLEMYASERGVLSMLRKKSLKNTKITLEKLTFKDVIKLYKKGDQAVINIFDEVAYYMGIGIANIVNLLEIGHIIIGGSIVEAGNKFLSTLKNEIQSHLQNILNVDLRLQFAKFNCEEAGAVGSIIPIASEYFKEPELKLNLQKIDTWGAYMHTSRY